MFLDFGRKVALRLHVDAQAAKGIIERRGLSKVSHLDLNVLWLQEAAARRDMPILKVPGENHPADLATKHLGSAKVEQLVSIINPSFEDGQAGIASNLHSCAIKDIGVGVNGKCNDMDGLKQAMLSLDNNTIRNNWSAIRSAGNKLTGGDRWYNRGGAGAWERWHITPRRTLFTPYKITKGPSKSVSLLETRFTCGVTKSGQRFEIIDKWKESDRSHLDLGENWLRYTVFLEEGCCNGDFQQKRGGQWISPKNVKWADLEP